MSDNICSDRREPVPVRPQAARWLKLASGLATVHSMDDPKLEEYILETVTRKIAALALIQVREALQLIANARPAEPQALRLAALRRYLRFQNVENRDIHASWAWTAREAEQRSREEPALTLMTRAQAVQVAFARNNPTYSLALSPVRSLASQVSLWNGNPGVQAAASTLKTQMLQILDDPAYGLPPTAEQVDAFASRLQFANINPEPGNAAPGLSSHGQMRAVDFVVMQGSTIVATTSVATSETVWRAQGWAERVATLARQANLSGPLRVPDEPWHWWVQ